jgi:hypothetical protein
MRRSLVGLMLLAALGGCDRGGSGGAPLGTFRCRCNTLTDTDVPGTKDVYVCTQTEERALAKAKSCAQGRTQLTVQSCKCGVVSESCPADACN